jgi:hypothetical protein
VGEAEALQIITSALNFGVLGIVFYLFVGSRLHSSGEMERERARADKAEEQRDAAMELAQKELMPLLASFTAATSSLLPILQDLVRTRDEEHRYREGHGERYPR